MKCPCNSNIPYTECCALYIEQNKTAPSAEALMRSRYTAYTQGNISYIAKTMRGKPLKGFNKKQAEVWAKSAKWLGLEVLNTSEYTVEFIARYIDEDGEQKLHENSAFKCSKGKWFYIGEAS